MSECLSNAAQREPSVYRPDQFFFSSPRGDIATAGRLSPLDSGPDLAMQAQVALDARRQPGAPPPVLVGAMPFNPAHRHALYVAEAYQRGQPHVGAPRLLGRLSDVSVGAAPRPHAHMTGVRPWPDESTYAEAVTQALHAFEHGELGKVVLARTLALSLSAPIDLPATCNALLAKQPRGGVFSVPTDDQGVFIGASPELLVRRAGRKVFLNPLAGSAARCVNAADDERAAQALLASDKDRREHAIVIDAIERVLRPLCRNLNIPAAPSVTATDALWHLSTEIEGELAEPWPSSLALAVALHPTPAVCGYPLQAARHAISQWEPFDRGLFAGFVGWMTADGDGEWAVSLRCAQIREDEAVLYAGAGIVPGSEPAREVGETQTKFRTMLSALGLADAIDPIDAATSPSSTTKESP